MALDLNPERAHIFRITHRDNARWVFKNGIHCASSHVRDPDFVSIGNADLIDKRANHRMDGPIPDLLSNFVPFYFTPHSMMMLNIKTGYRGVTKRPNADIIIIVSSLRRLAAEGRPFVFTDRHAYMRTARVSQDLNDLDWIDWDLLRRRDFARDPNDPGKTDRYQAEALVHGHLPVTSVVGVACFNDSVAAQVSAAAKAAGAATRVIAKPGWYF